MILTENDVAYNVTAEDFKALVSDRAAGINHPLDCYGFEVGNYGGDVSDFGVAPATVLQAAMRPGDHSDGALSPALSVRISQLSAIIDEETMFFAAGATVAA